MAGAIPRSRSGAGARLGKGSAARSVGCTAEAGRRPRNYRPTAVKGRGATASHRAAPRRAPRSCPSRRRRWQPGRPRPWQNPAKPAARPPPAAVRAGPAKAAPGKPEPPAVVAPAAAMYSVRRSPPAPPRPVPAAAAAVSARPATPDRHATANGQAENLRRRRPRQIRRRRRQGRRIATEEIAGHKLDDPHHVRREPHERACRWRVRIAGLAARHAQAVRRGAGGAGRAWIKRTWSRRAQYEAINSGDPLAMPRWRDLYRTRAAGPELSER